MTTSTIGSTVPTDVADVYELIMSCNELTKEQLKCLVVYEAGLLGLEYDEAVELALKNELPKNALGTSVQFMILMLHH